MRGSVGAACWKHGQEEFRCPRDGQTSRRWSRPPERASAGTAREAQRPPIKFQRQQRGELPQQRGPVHVACSAREQILKPGLGLSKQFFVESLANVRDGIETPFPCPLQEVLGLVCQVLLNFWRDLRFPAHPAQCLIEDRYRHAATCRLLLLPIDLSRLLRLLLEKLHGSQPSAQISNDRSGILFDHFIGHGRDKGKRVVLTKVSKASNQPFVLCNCDIRIPNAGCVYRLGDQRRDPILLIGDVGDLVVPGLETVSRSDLRRKNVYSDLPS